jgi:hypothetical protein
MKVTDTGDYTISIDHALKHETFNKQWETQFELERSSFNKTFSNLHISKGNLKDLISDAVIVKETVHDQYKNKRKIISIENVT